MRLPACYGEFFAAPRPVLRRKMRRQRYRDRLEAARNAELQSVLHAR